MRSRFSFLLLGLLASTAPLVACSASEQEEEEVGEVEGELVQFPASAFTNAPSISYGSTSADIATSRTKWGVVKFSGSKDDAFLATVNATVADRMARAYLVEKRSDGKYVSVLSGTSSSDGLVKGKLAKTQTYFIVFRDYSRRNATFNVKLEKQSAMPAACNGGSPLLNKGFVDRTPQAQEPSISIQGTFKSSVRRCNVATGCAAPVVNEYAAPLSFSRRTDGSGKWVGSGWFDVEHDGATGDLTGKTSVSADDGRSIEVSLTGAATTTCVALSGGARNEIDGITYYDVEVTYSGTTPPVEARTTHPASPPAPECDGDPSITDEELLARFEPGEATRVLGAGPVKEDSQYCHPETGCEPWARNDVRKGYSYSTYSFSLDATAHVLGASSIGLVLRDTYTNLGTQTLAVEDGVITVNEDVLSRAQPNTKYTGEITDTHVLVKEKTVFKDGDRKYRRYVCIPIPAHP
jgi:hypothetical protein